MAVEKTAKGGKENAVTSRGVVSLQHEKSSTPAHKILQ